MLQPRAIPVIYGPTAAGKSDLAVSLAQWLKAEHGRSAEIIAADAFQVYRGMDIGTAKPSLAERRGVPHHMIDLVEASATEPFTVEDWLAGARRAIEEVRGRGAVPIVVGGTALYVQSLLYGLFEGPPADESLREQLRALPAGQLHQELQRVDAAAAARIHPADTRRTIRAIEVFRLTGKPISEHQRQWQWGGRTPDVDLRLFVVTWPKEELASRINSRVKAMMRAGLLEEVVRLVAAGGLGPQAREGLGYKQILAHLARCQVMSPGASARAESFDAAVEQIKIETRRFAKNQRTWLKRIGATPGAVEAPRAEMGVVKAALV